MASRFSLLAQSVLSTTGLAFSAATRGTIHLGSSSRFVKLTHLTPAASNGASKESAEKSLSLEDILKEARSDSEDFVFSDDGAPDSGDVAEDLLAPKDQVGSSKPAPPEVLPSAEDMSKVLSAYIESPPKSEDVTVSQLKDALASQDPLILLDVRMPSEFSQGHVPGAINVPLPEVASRVVDGSLALEGKQVAVICQAGGRSARAVSEMSQLLNLEKPIWNVLGGTSVWISSGYPVDA